MNEEEIYNHIVHKVLGDMADELKRDLVFMKPTNIDLIRTGDEGIKTVERMLHLLKLGGMILKIEQLLDDMAPVFADTNEIK